MSSTNHVIGIVEGGRSSSRVLKPPGGGSSDIFGGDAGSTPQARPVVKNHLKSSLFIEPTSPATNGNPETNGIATTNGTSNGHATPKGNKNVIRNPVTGEGIGVDGLTRSARKREGRNPVTGEGYTGDERDSAPTANIQQKQRVPPGGYTTPLW